MSVATQDASRPSLFAAAGFYPDAVGYALRTTAALLLAYFAAFAIQLDSASSAGLCVAITAQPTLGMTLSKAIYRMAGTVLGGVVALGMVAAFPQNRTLLLIAFTLWLGACTFVAALLRDFRSYGAVLCGYTVGIIAITGIDAPQGVLTVALDRCAAIAIGIVAVALVNIASSGTAALDGLVESLHARIADVTGLALRALRGEGPLEDGVAVTAATQIVALESMASHLAAERADGPIRSAGARNAIAGLLGMLSAARGIASIPPASAGAGTAAVLADTAWRMGRPTLPRPVPRPDSLEDCFLEERSQSLLRYDAVVRAGMTALLDGEHAPPPVRLRQHYDPVGAAFSAGRTVIAVGLGSVFCVVAGWPGVTALLVQQAAFTALLGMQPNPTRAGVAMAWSLPIPALAAGAVGFWLLPAVSGFVPFAIAVGWASFGLAMLARHPRLVSLGPGLLLYFTLLLGPANQEPFDLTAFVNGILIQGVALIFMVLAFQVIFPVSRKRRLYRIADAIAADLRTTMRQGRPLDQPAVQSVHFDRLVQARQWLGVPSKARLAVMHRLFSFAELDVAMRRAWSGLDALPTTSPAAVAAIRAARESLRPPDPGAMAAAAQALLRQHARGDAPDSVLFAVSGLYGARTLMLRERRALLHYGLLAG